MKVIDETSLLKGVISLRDIVVNSFDVKIADIMNRSAMSIPVDMDKEEVGHIFEKYGYLTMPVIKIIFNCFLTLFLLELFN
ncbi:hypothetical protein LGK95_08265 [Clostridium algoriphilum]|uniref:CBS domain-containing protein n=1 Tax=Clostridium algoriphilum TaxID=198347 RepID=UPI001CF328D3|nr:CBS domain-containing protein [Clostridium algoriphilum]MCB2293514.1 hypothetical protein [Clostridium algoriphilum]